MRGYILLHFVAPVRERGLKSLYMPFLLPFLRRSREGAWIEIPPYLIVLPIAHSRSREGAWIEICVNIGFLHISPSRSREGAWIEMPL